MRKIKRYEHFNMIEGLDQTAEQQAKGMLDSWIEEWGYDGYENERYTRYLDWLKGEVE
ncbi:hypothetical protein EUAN_08810 [Andreesenia angusta]|uniref:Uncharacterized protein n=1 Tax=Andreesenia angusta TaxID=39480 RepID=A0A1S1VAD9_9FIRM|nr:hypothetical protein [Andreesenia angusta]OHW63097.1 hypothetical protein EUAN_08810 [Andreesenia angusta]